MILDLILLQADEGGEILPTQGLPFWLLMGGILVVFYFFMIRPQQKKQKEENAFRDGLQKGDKVITIGGIFGRISQVDEASILVEVDSGTKLKMEKAAVKPIPEADAQKS